VPIREASQARQLIDNPHTRQRGRDGAELPANLLDGTGFGIKRVDMAGSAAHPEEDATDGTLSGIAGGSGEVASLEKSRQGQPEHGQPADLDELTPRGSRAVLKRPRC